MPNDKNTGTDPVVLPYEVTTKVISGRDEHGLIRYIKVDDYGRLVVAPQGLNLFPLFIPLVFIMIRLGEVISELKKLNAPKEPPK
jgi:hypothetical protein